MLYVFYLALRSLSGDDNGFYFWSAFAVVDVLLGGVFELEAVLAFGVQEFY